jgi:two-component system NtrC family sensor kinase
VFLNLVVNAAQAVGEAGHIRLVTGRESTDGLDWGVVHVEDDGPGIPTELLDRIFDPFFTTKPAGEGCGLGLAISYQIVRKHGGDLAVRSRPGQGTCFTVRLPAQEDVPAAEAAAPERS